MVVLSYPEEMIGKKILWVSTGPQVINMGFTDGTCYSIKLKEVEWDAKEHLERLKLQEIT